MHVVLLIPQGEMLVEYVLEQINLLLIHDEYVDVLFGGVSHPMLRALGGSIPPPPPPANLCGLYLLD